MTDLQTGVLWDEPPVVEELSIGASPPPAQIARAEGYHYYTLEQRALRFCVWLFALGWWLWTDGPQGYDGLYEIIGAISTFDAPPDVRWVLYGLIVIPANLFIAWVWAERAALTATWGDTAKALLSLGLVALVANGIDIGTSAVGLYGYFLPVGAGVMQWTWFWAAFAVSFVGSFVAPIVAARIFGSWWHGRAQVVEDE